jgi:hypothetical protein
MGVLDTILAPMLAVDIIDVVASVDLCPAVPTSENYGNRSVRAPTQTGSMQADLAHQESPLFFFFLKRHPQDLTLLKMKLFELTTCSFPQSQRQSHFKQPLLGSTEPMG